jgi:hypothetical protein
MVKQILLLVKEKKCVLFENQLEIMALEQVHREKEKEMIKEKRYLVSQLYKNEWHSKDYVIKKNNIYVQNEIQLKELKETQQLEMNALIEKQELNMKKLKDRHAILMKSLKEKEDIEKKEIIQKYKIAKQASRALQEKWKTGKKLKWEIRRKNQNKSKIEIKSFPKLILKIF